MVCSAVGAAAAVLPGVGCSEPAVDKLPHRWIDQSRCIACGSCVPLCPMGAIGLGDKASVNPDECAECGVCQRSRVCPQDAIRAGDLKWPRTLRQSFSNPLVKHESTGVLGRGTEGIKTNDVTLRYRRGFVGVFVEPGRPAVGTRFADVERVVKKFKLYGYSVADDNPVAELIADPATGALKPEILREKAISVLIEFIIPEREAPRLERILGELSAEVETVFNVSIALRAEPDGASPLDELLGRGTFRLPNGKVNLGIAGRIAGRQG